MSDENLTITAVKKSLIRILHKHDPQKLVIP